MVRAVLAVALFICAGAPAFAQTSTLSGVVLDSSGGAIPGADVVIKHNATGVTTSGVSNTEGAFSFPGVQTGTYTVTVTLQGFKTFVANDVVLTTGTPASVKAVLEVGGVSETVTVSSTSEIIQTQSSTVSSTVSMNQITKLPMVSRSGMDFVNFLPGVSTPGGNRDATVNGLPQSFINITLDGVNIQDNMLRSSDGFFALVSPRLDAIEEVTVSTASQGASDAGQGAVQVRFVTRSGSNDFTGSLYETFRSDKLNANTWFNNRDGVELAKLTQNQPGGRVGGPIVIPGLFDGRSKAFFFVNYEEFRQPGETTRTSTMLHPRAEQGFYRYTTAAGVREINVLDVAAANGQLTALDPTVASILAAVRQAAGTTGTITDNTAPMTQSYRFNQDAQTLNRFPTVRLDYNITDAHRLSSAYNYQKYSTNPDLTNDQESRFPGFLSAGQGSSRTSWSNSLRSTFGSLVNELKVAYAGAPVLFYQELDPGDFANTAGVVLDFPIMTDPTIGANKQGRNAWNVLIEDSINWLKGSHSITAGGSFTHFQVWSETNNQIPTVTLGMLSGDPAFNMFNATTFPGASNTQLNEARALYALLTGRVSGVNGDARLENGRYVYMGTARQEGRMRQADLFVQDSWRWKPNFTVNAGLRYSLQFPFAPLNNSYSTATLTSLCGKSGINDPDDVEQLCNLFAPGTLDPNITPEYVNFGEGVNAHNVDYNNLAPSLGFAWVLGDRNGVLGAVLGDDAVIRGGYTLSHSRQGLSDYTGTFGGNPGLSLTAAPDRNASNLGTLPVLLSQPDRLGPAPFPETPVYPFRPGARESVNIYDPNIQVPWADTYSIGLQRALGRNHVVEARYVGTRSNGGWTTYNYNETNIVENGFLDEFRLAQQNLQANIAAGRGNTFAYFGPGTGTNPLPIYLAHFSGINPSRASDASLYTSANFRNSTFYNPLTMRNPNPYASSNTAGAAGNNVNNGLFGNPTFKANMLAAGLPANFWVANPDVLNANIVGNGGRTYYNSAQFELRRRLHQGLQFNSSYVFGKAYGSNRFSFRYPREMRRDTGSPGDLTHQLKANVVYDLPFGRGRKFASDAGAIMERLVGGWSVGVNARVQSGRLINLGNVRLMGMTEADVQDMFDLRITSDGRVYMFPDAIMDESIKAFSTSATSASGYGSLGAPSGQYFAPANGPDCIEIAPGKGDCGVGDLVVTGPVFRQFDIAVSKRIALFGTTNLELRAEALNAFNHVNFVPVAGVGGDERTDWEVTGLTGTGARVLQLVGRFNF